MNIRPLAFIDTSTLIYGFVHRRREPRALDVATLEAWPAMRKMLARLANEASMLLDGRPAEVVAAEIDVLEVQEARTWWSQPDAQFFRLHLPLIPSPSAALYCGGEIATPPVGQLTFVNPRVLNSAANFGTSPRVHLVADIALKITEDDDPDS